MNDEDELPPQEYISYNGLGRNPMIWGIPYMAGLFIICVSILPAFFLGAFVGSSGWLFALIAVPLLLFTKIMCETDDKALQILGKEIKWSFVKWSNGNAALYGGTLTIAPATYGRKRRNVEQGITATMRG